MDQCTHEVRAEYWKRIIQACGQRPAGQSAKSWMEENGICEQSYYHWQRKFLDILVREYRCSGGTDTASPAAGNRCSGTGIPHLIDCYLRVYSLKAGFNPYTSRIER